MVVSIPAGFEEFVQQEIATGRYRSAEEVVSEGLRLLQRLNDQRQALRDDIQAGIDTPGVAGDTVFAQLERKAAEIAERAREQR